MKNFIQTGDTITLTAAAAHESGDPVYINGMFGVAANTVAIGGDLVLNLTGVYELPKATGQTWAVGARLYWNGTAITSTVQAGNLVGMAADVAETGATLGRVRLNGTTTS